LHAEPVSLDHAGTAMDCCGSKNMNDAATTKQNTIILFNIFLILLCMVNVCILKDAFVPPDVFIYRFSCIIPLFLIPPMFWGIYFIERP